MALNIFKNFLHKYLSHSSIHVAIIMSVSVLFLNTNKYRAVPSLETFIEMERKISQSITVYQEITVDMSAMR